MSKNKYTLVSLECDLYESKVLYKCYKFKKSADSRSICISYLDFKLEEQFILVFRTSRLCYRVFFEGSLHSLRTCKEAKCFILNLLDELIDKNKFMKVMTVEELREISEFTHSDRMNFFKRLDDIKQRARNKR